LLLDRLIVSIEVQLDKFNQGMDASVSKLNDFGQKATKAGSTLTKGVTLPLLAMGGAVVKFGADFEKSMTQSLAIMGDDAVKYRDQMELVARDVAKTTMVSATEAADSYFYLASAGMDAEQAMAALPQVAKFAQAGMFDMARATDLATDAQSALGLSVEDPIKNLENLTRVTDVLVGANTLANATVEQFSEALTNKAGAALRLLNKDVEEGAAVLAVYADQGIKGAAAGEQLNIMSRDLQRAALANVDAFKQAGVSVYDAEGKMRNYADIVEDLEGYLDGMSDAEKRASITKLGFTDRSINATMALLGTSDQIREYEASLRDMAGMTDEVANNQMNNFWDQLKLVKDQLIDVALGIYEDLGPALMDYVVPALKSAAEFVGKLAEWFGKLSGPMKLAIVGFLGIMAAIGPLLLIAGQIAFAIANLLPVFGAIAGVLSGPIILAIAAVIAIVALLILNWDKVKAVVVPIIDAIKDAWSSFVGGFTSEAGTLDAAMGRAFDPIYNFGAALRELFDNVSDIIGKGISIIQTFFALLDFTPYVETFNMVKDAVLNALNPVVEFFTGLFADALAFVNEKVQFFKDWMMENWPLIQQTIGTVANAANAHMQRIAKVVQFVTTVIMAIWKRVWPYIQIVVETVWNVIKTVVTTTINTILGVIKAVMQAINGDWRGAWKTMEDTARGLVKGLLTVIGNILRGLGRIVIQPFRQAYQDLLGWVSNFKGAGGRLIQGVIDGITEKIAKVKEAAGKVAKAVRDFLPFSPAKEGPLKDLDKVGQGFYDTLASGLTKAAQQMPSVMMPIADAMLVGGAYAGPALATAATTIHQNNTIHFDKIEIASDYDVERMAEKLDELLEQKRRAAGER